MRRFRVVMLGSIALLGCACRYAAPAADSVRIEEEVVALLTAQQRAWNAGDIEGFMAGYWRSPELRFASGGEISRGWRPTLERYQTRYPDRAAMGRLTFSDLEVTVVSPRAVLVFGKWALEREADAPWGLFTLVLRRLPEGWRVVSDHTSSGDA